MEALKGRHALGSSSISTDLAATEYRRLVFDTCRAPQCDEGLVGQEHGGMLLGAQVNHDPQREEVRIESVRDHT
jgi:hypothetical protein